MNIFKKMFEDKQKNVKPSKKDVEAYIMSKEFLESETFKKLIETEPFQNKLGEVLKPQFDEFYDSLNKLPQENRTAPVEVEKKSAEQIFNESLKKENNE